MPQLESQPHRRRIAIAIHALHGGGSEHVAAMMADWWAAEGNEVTLITLADTSTDTIAMSSQVRRIGLGLVGESNSLAQAIHHNRQRVRGLRQELLMLQPDCVVSLVDRMNVLTLLACKGTTLPVFACERTDVRHHQIGRLWSTLRRWAYPRAKRVVVQTSSVQAALQKLIPRAQAVCIPNFVRSIPRDEGAAAAQSALDRSAHWICGVGRLSAEKGIDLLITAFAQLATQFPDWNVVIVGDGSERTKLEAQIRNASLESRVRLLGWSERPWNLLVGAEVFAAPSRYEGFPNALLEAMARGLAVVTADCDSGPREIVQSETNGLLVPRDDIATLARALSRLMADSELRAKLGENARAVTEQFSPQKHFQRWEQLFNECGIGPSATAR